MARVRVLWNRGGAYNGQIKSVSFVDIDRMYDAGVYLAVQLENRTQGGRDEAGNKFRPYTAAYARAKNVARTAVDLTRSGEMFASFGVLWAARNRVRIGFSSAAMERRARYNEGMGRKFLGLDPRWLTEVHRRLKNGLRF